MLELVKDAHQNLVRAINRQHSLICMLPASLDDYITDDNPVRVVEAFIDELDLAVLSFAGMSSP